MISIGAAQPVSRLDDLKLRARRLKAEVFALYLAYRDPRVPWYAKGVIACVVAYALSPIDLIPDFVPVLGYLDDLIIVPFGISMALRLMPNDVMTEYRVKAESLLAEKPKKNNWIVGGLIIALWLGAAYLIIRAFWR